DEAPSGANDHALPHGTGADRVLKPAATSARAAVVHVTLLIEPVIDDAVAVVVDTIADLDAAVGLQALAPVGRIVIGIAVAEGAAAELALAARAGGRGVREQAVVAALPAVVGVGLQIVAFVDLAVAVVIQAVADLGEGQAAIGKGVRVVGVDL